jgi:hypothetical protein
MIIIGDEPQLSNKNANSVLYDDDDDDDNDDDGNDLSEDCGSEHGCLGPEMTTTGKCLLKAGHNTQHYCFLCGSWF